MSYAEKIEVSLLLLSGPLLLIVAWTVYEIADIRAQLRSLREAHR